MSKDRKKEISSLTQYMKMIKLHRMGKNNVKLELPNLTLLFTHRMQFYQFYVQICVA